uniref:Uncharacterized protein n=1 Tax=Pseudictyota dubia TaxID=2749911 RepID=A0A7R9WBL1_9STRA
MPLLNSLIRSNSDASSDTANSNNGDDLQAALSFEEISLRNIPVRPIPRRAGRLRSAIQQRSLLRIIPTTNPTTTDNTIPTNYSEPAPLFLLQDRGPALSPSSSGPDGRPPLLSDRLESSSQKPPAALSPDERTERLISILQMALEPQFARLES